MVEEIFIHEAVAFCKAVVCITDASFSSRMSKEVQKSISESVYKCINKQVDIMD